MSSSKPIVVSACLAGFKCRYDGDNNLNTHIEEMVKNGSAIPVCPEELGGLTTPRIPAEIVVQNDGSHRVINRDGQDVTEQFLSGAQKALKVAQEIGAESAILKHRSPSCGCGQIYDGSFSKSLVKANGITADLFIKNGIKVTTEEDYKN